MIANVKEINNNNNNNNNNSNKSTFERHEWVENILNHFSQILQYMISSR